MSLINPDYDSSNQFNPVDLLDNLSQNDIDFLCKTFQLWHDYFFGEDNDDSNLDQIQPYTCSFTACLNSTVSSFGGQPVNLNGQAQSQAHLLYTFSFDGYNAHTSGMMPVYADPILNQNTETGTNNLAVYMAGCEAAANGTYFTYERLDDIEYSNDRCIAGYFREGVNSGQNYFYPASFRLLNMENAANGYGFNLTPAKPYYQLFRNSVVYGGGGSATTSHTSDVICVDFHNQPAYIDNNATSASGYYRNWNYPQWNNTYKTWVVKPFVGKGAFVSINSNNEYQISDSFQNTFIDASTYNNTYNYTTNNGDTITTDYGDNYINISVPDDTGISYDDLFEILNHIVIDLNVNGNIIDGDGNSLQLTIPTFEEIKYSDRGSLYIGKWNEYPNNIAPRPVAVDTINNDIVSSGDILPEWTATVGTILSTGVNGFMSLLPDWVGILLGVCFLTAFFARNMRKGG